MHTQNFFRVYTVEILCLNSSIVLRSEQNEKNRIKFTETKEEREKESKKKRKKKRVFLFLEQALYIGPCLI